MNEFVIQELKFLVPLMAISFVVFIYYKERDVYYYKRYATFFPRLWASFIDLALLWPIGVVVGIGLNFLSVENETIHWLANNLLAFTYPCYFILFHGRYDATLGKMACKIRLLRVKGEKSISVGRAFLRDFIPLACMVGIFGWVVAAENSDELMQSLPSIEFRAIYFLWLLIELVTMLFSRRGRALQDYLAGTVVVRSDR